MSITSYYIEPEQVSVYQNFKLLPPEKMVDPKRAEIVETFSRIYLTHCKGKDAIFVINKDPSRTKFKVPNTDHLYLSGHPFEVGGIHRNVHLGEEWSSFGIADLIITSNPLFETEIHHTIKYTGSKDPHFTKLHKLIYTVSSIDVSNIQCSTIKAPDSAYLKLPPILGRLEVPTLHEITLYKVKKIEVVESLSISINDLSLLSKVSTLVCTMDDGLICKILEAVDIKIVSNGTVYTRSDLGY